MLSYNKQFKYKVLYERLTHICNASCIEDIGYNLGVLCGWTSAKLHVDFTQEEIDNVCKLGFELAKQRKEYLKEKYDEY